MFNFNTSMERAKNPHIFGTYPNQAICTKILYGMTNQLFFMCEEAGLGIMESRNLRDPDCIRGLTVRCLTYQMNELDTLFMYILYILSICDNDLFHFGDQSTTFGGPNPTCEKTQQSVGYVMGI